MSFYENKLKLVESSFKQLLDENKLIVETKSNLIKSVSDLRLLFTTKFNQCICDLEIVINAAKEIEVKQENINDNEIEESPASIRPILIWPNDSKIWVHDKSLRKSTFTINSILPPTFNIPVRVVKATTYSMVIGLSTVELDTDTQYLGGDMDNSWGIAGNASLGEHHQWKHGKTYEEGDIVTISGNNGVISYHISDDDNSSYQFDMGTTTLYLAVSLSQGFTLELLI